MHRYRSHTCGALRASDIGNDVRLSGWCHRVRDHGGVLFIDLRDHYGITQVVADPDSPAFKVAETLRSEWVVRIDGKVRRRPEGTVNPDLPTGEVEVYIREIEVLGRAAELPMPVFGEQEYPEDIRLRYRFLDLRREHLHRNIMKRGAVIELVAPADERAGLLRIPDPDSHGFVAGRRARFSGALAPASRQVLRAAAGAAAIQAADHDFRLRPVFSDRAVLSRRRRARRPLARRILSARSGDELRHPGRRVRRGRARDPRRVRGIRRRQAGDADISAHSLWRSAAQIRRRQAGSAQSDRHAGCVGHFPRLRFQDFRSHSGDERYGRGVGDPGAGRRLARLLRPDELLGARRRAAGPGLYFLCAGECRRGWPRPGRQQSGAGADGEVAFAAAIERRRCRILRRRRAADFRQICRRRAHQGRRRSRSDRQEPIRIVLDRRFSDVRMERGGEEDRLLPQSFFDAEFAAGGISDARSGRQGQNSRPRRRSNTTSSATAWNCPPAPSAIIGRM